MLLMKQALLLKFFFFFYFFEIFKQNMISLDVASFSNKKYL